MSSSDSLVTNRWPSQSDSQSAPFPDRAVDSPIESRTNHPHQPPLLRYCLDYSSFFLHSLLPFADYRSVYSLDHCHRSLIQSPDRLSRWISYMGDPTLCQSNEGDYPEKWHVRRLLVCPFLISKPVFLQWLQFTNLMRSFERAIKLLIERYAEVYQIDRAQLFRKTIFAHQIYPDCQRDELVAMFQSLPGSGIQLLRSGWLSKADVELAIEAFRSGWVPRHQIPLGGLHNLGLPYGTPFPSHLLSEQRDNRELAKLIVQQCPALILESPFVSDVEIASIAAERGFVDAKMPEGVLTDRDLLLRGLKVERVRYDHQSHFFLNCPHLASDKEMALILMSRNIGWDNLSAKLKGDRDILFTLFRSNKSGDWDKILECMSDSKPFNLWEDRELVEALVIGRCDELDKKLPTRWIEDRQLAQRVASGGELFHSFNADAEIVIQALNNVNRPDGICRIPLISQFCEIVHPSLHENHAVLLAAASAGVPLNRMPKLGTTEREIVKEALSRGHSYLSSAANHYHSDRELIMTFCRFAKVFSALSDLAILPPSYLDEKEFILFAMRLDGEYERSRVLAYASARLQNDLEVVLAGIKFPVQPQWIGEEIKNDRFAVLEIVKHDGNYLGAMAEEFRSDREIALLAVASSPFALKYLSPTLRADRTFLEEVCILRGLKYRSSPLNLNPRAGGRGSLMLHHASILPLDARLVSLIVRSSRAEYIDLAFPRSEHLNYFLTHPLVIQAFLDPTGNGIIFPPHNKSQRYYQLWQLRATQHSDPTGTAAGTAELKSNSLILYQPVELPKFYKQSPLNQISLDSVAALMREADTQSNKFPRLN